MTSEGFLVFPVGGECVFVVGQVKIFFSKARLLNDKRWFLVKPLLVIEQPGFGKKKINLTYYKHTLTTKRIACENIGFSSLFAAVDVSRGGTSTAATSEEKRMFSQATKRKYY